MSTKKRSNLTSKEVPMTRYDVEKLGKLIERYFAKLDRPQQSAQQDNCCLSGQELLARLLLIKDKSDPDQDLDWVI